jgi:hypothetical protein
LAGPSKVKPTTVAPTGTGSMITASWFAPLRLASDTSIVVLATASRISTLPRIAGDVEGRRTSDHAPHLWNDDPGRG